VVAYGWLVVLLHWLPFSGYYGETESSGDSFCGDCDDRLVC